MSTQAQVFGGLSKVSLPEKPCHVAVGMFDGLHRGHQAVIEGAVHAAESSGGLAGVFTFWPHPSRLFRPDDPTHLIFSAEERRELMMALGLHFIVEQPFTREFAAITADEFVPHLMEGLPGLSTLYVGENWQFGRGRQGDVSSLVSFATKQNVSVVSVARLNYNGEPISSTRIRREIAEGQIQTVNELLGFPYFCSGEVVPGRRLGRQIGFPTLNIDWTPDQTPALGVYVVSVSAVDSEDRVFPAVANYGVRPTVDGEGKALLEVHLLGACPFKPGDCLKIRWHRRLRAEQRFDSVRDLRDQIGRDREAAATFFSSELS